MRHLPFLLALTLLLASCGKIADPEFRRVEGFGIKNFSLQETVVGFKVTYFNPNKFGVTVKETAVDVYINNSLVGNFRQPETIDVGKAAEFSIPLEGKIDVKTALKLNLPELIGTEVLIKAIGNVRVGKAGVFVTKPIKYEGRQVISADLLKNPAGAGF
jgi:LEA14-like dessication related protein